VCAMGLLEAAPRAGATVNKLPHVRARKMFVLVMIVAIMLGVLLRAEVSATSIRFRNAGAANRCCCDPRSTTESAEKAPATLRLISSGSVYAITARPMMPLLHTRSEGASKRTAAHAEARVWLQAVAGVAAGVDRLLVVFARESTEGTSSSQKPAPFIIYSFHRLYDFHRLYSCHRRGV
jgi:hypothetical protein